MKTGLFALIAVVLLAFVVGCSSTGSVGPKKAAVAATPTQSAAPSLALPTPATTSQAQAITSAPVPAMAGNKVVLWNFESKTTDGWSGRDKWSEAVTVNDDPSFVREGKYSLKINAKGSNGWNQDIAVNEGPLTAELSKLKAVTMDVYVPKETIEGLPYLQLFLVVSGSANAWYQVAQELKAGWNSAEFKIDTDSVNGDIWQVYFVLNTSMDLNGPIYIDNVVGRY